MADAMRPPMGGVPGSGGGDPMAAMKDNMSMMNPVDIAGMKSPNHPGYIDPQKTTVREYFEKNGVDVDGPIVQLVKFAQDQAGKANPIQKMRNIAGAGQSPGGAPPPAPGGGMPQGGGPGGPGGSGLEALMGEMGG